MQCFIHVAPPRAFCKIIRMPRHRVTMDDLARRLDLSKCTISRILNRAFDGFSYAPATVRRVDNMARRLGYRPNIHARALRTRRSHLIGLALPTGSIPFFGVLTEHLEAELRAAGYQVLVVHSRNNPRAEEEVLRSLADRGVDGLLWIPVRTRYRAKDSVFRSGIPRVLLDRPIQRGGLPLVATDNRAATRDLGNRLRALGHSSVLAFNAPRADLSMIEREQGLRDVLGDGLVVKNMANVPAAARAAVRALPEAGPRFTALVALSELLSLGALAGLRDLAWSIPDRISFAGFDDFPLAAHWTPPVTVIRQDLPRLAAAAAAALLAQLRAPAETPASVRVPSILEWRASLAPPPQIHG